MDKLVTWIRTFGNAGAVANAHELKAQQRREDWIMRGLTARIARAAEESDAAAA
jgi:hypothetical protein